MIPCDAFFSLLKEQNISFFTGVPDSLLKDICAYITDNTSGKDHLITANEGSAVALASGHYLATGNLGLVYMQNSGQGNTINPLVSLADPEVYSIPMLLMIGWRGEPGVKDEPQHLKQGKVTVQLLETLGIPYKILPDNLEEAKNVIGTLATQAKNESRPVAFVVRKGTFEKYSLQNKIVTNYEHSRESALKLVVDQLKPEDVIVSTTGKTSRELFEYREERNEGHEKDFLTVGSMGHSSMIALGVALEKPDKTVYCFDGDGAVIMHMGSLGIIGQTKPKNFKHIVFNNGAHDSVGGQPTVGFDIDIPSIAKACGYGTVLSAQSSEEIKTGMGELQNAEGPALLEIKVNKGARSDLGRPTTTPIQNKEALMRFLKGI